MERGKKPAAIFLITSKCFITVSVGMVRVIRCHRRNMKINIIDGSEVSRLSVAIHCFPFPVITQSLKFDNTDSELIQVLKYYGLGIVVLTITLLPAFYFIHIKNSVSYIKQSMTTFGLALLFLIALSLMLPVIPTLIVNFAARLVGINGFEVIRPAISVENRPAEKFKDPQWHLSTSNDGRFYLFDGVKLFSFGTLELLCPPNVLDSYKATLHYILASKRYDEETRKMLHKETKTCQIFNIEDLRY